MFSRFLPRIRKIDPETIRAIIWKDLEASDIDPEKYLGNSELEASYPGHGAHNLTYDRMAGLQEWGVGTKRMLIHPGEMTLIDQMRCSQDGAYRLRLDTCWTIHGVLKQGFMEQSVKQTMKQIVKEVAIQINNDPPRMYPIGLDELSLRFSQVQDDSYLASNEFVLNLARDDVLWIYVWHLSPSPMALDFHARFSQFRPSGLTQSC